MGTVFIPHFLSVCQPTEENRFLCALQKAGKYVECTPRLVQKDTVRSKVKSSSKSPRLYIDFFSALTGDRSSSSNSGEFPLRCT